jgi:uncharacterized membrane protein YvbJ
MRPCQQCNAAIANNVRTCPECGHEQSPTVGLPNQATANVAPDLHSNTEARRRSNSNETDASDHGLVMIGQFVATIVLIGSLPTLGYFAFGGPGVVAGVVFVVILLIGFQIMSGIG